MNPSEPIEFLDRTFCFTGKMTDMLRRDAEREVRARGGMTQNTVGPKLDYLVVGDRPSPGWAFGDFGNKIMQALDYRAHGSEKPLLIPENVFLDALTATPRTNSGVIDSKIVACTYRAFLDESRVPSKKGLTEMADLLAATDDCHVKVKVFRAASLEVVFSSDGVSTHSDGWDIVVRVVKVADLDYEAGPLVASVKRILHEWLGDHGTLSVIERKEGSASFAMYFRQIPRSKRVQFLTTDRR